MTNADLQQALTMQEIVRAYGNAINLATTLQSPASLSPVQIHRGVAEGGPLRRASLLKRTAVRFIAWFG